MFDEIKNWLMTLAPEDKANLINNLKEFSRLKTMLEARGALTRCEKTGAFLIVKDDPNVEAFLQVFKKMTMKGVEVKDQRKKVNN